LRYRNIPAQIFKLKVTVPRVIRKHKEALTKEDIIRILEACSDSLKLKTYLLFLAATGYVCSINTELSAIAQNQTGAGNMTGGGQNMTLQEEGTNGMNKTAGRNETAGDGGASPS
jgi:hypothetical protein